MTHTLEHGSVGHASPTTVLRDQRAIEERHRPIAEALDQLSQAARIPVDSVAWCDRYRLFVPTTDNAPTRGNNVSASSGIVA